MDTPTEYAATSRAMTRLPLTRLDVCICGFPALDERIGLSAVYNVDLSSRRHGFSWKCGGCGLITPVEIVECNSILSPKSKPAPLPWMLFEVAA